MDLFRRCHAKAISCPLGIHFFVNIFKFRLSYFQEFATDFLKLHRLTKFGTINRFMETNFCFNENHKKSQFCVTSSKRFFVAEYNGKQSILFYSNRTHHTTKKMVVPFCTLHLPPPKMVSWLHRPPFYQGLKQRKRFKLPWIVSLAMQVSCKQNIKDLFQLLRSITFVHVVHQIGGVLYNPPSTKHGGSLSSTLVMTTSLNLIRI